MVDILHPNRDGGSGEAWLHFDNEAVNAVHHKDVFWGQGNERAAVDVLIYSSIVAPVHRRDDLLSLFSLDDVFLFVTVT